MSPSFSQRMLSSHVAVFRTALLSGGEEEKDPSQFFQHTGGFTTVVIPATLVARPLPAETDAQ